MAKCKAIFDLPNCCTSCPCCESVDLTDYGEITGYTSYNCTLLPYYSDDYNDSILEQEVRWGEFEWMHDRRHDKCPLIVIED